MGDSLLIKKFVTIYYGNRRFYLPHVPSNIYLLDDKLEIFLEDMDSYVIVDGIRCYYNLNYEPETDILHTRLKDFELDGIPCPEPYPLSFPVSAKSFPFNRRDSRVVVPRRDYSEVVAAYLSEHGDLDSRIAKFLENHPEVFDQVEDIGCWGKLSKLVDFPEFDADLLEDYLPQSVAELFENEVMS